MVTRMSGLASGLDIDSIVTKLMKAERTSLDTIVKKRTKIEWQQEAYRDINAKIVDFRNNKLANYSLSASIGAKTSDVTGNTNAITVNSTSSSASGTLNISVDAVAKSAYTVYSYTPTAPDSVDTTGKTLAQLGFSSNTITITQPSGTTSVTVDTSTDTLATLAAKINADKSTNATASYNNATGQFSIVSKNTGSGFITMDNTVKFAEAKTSGANAKATINGIAYEQASNTFDMNGINFTVRNQTSSSDPTTVSVKTDTTTILNTIKSFINDYNTLIGAINGKLGEKTYRDFMPLTEDEKKRDERKPNYVMGRKST
ncbi:flagellar filament capping protein FliD [Cohnella ginsengisoli]|uniref:Filament cap protein n=1 Tax=Cohnella ginsengisoli TaxID=425004 RepID=A0A9X4KM22_9BACL|nr:flagellar filament capping protein FliD [Cohnella ginsengisoli]MDG0794573.1 flagellar filament capping protein FliD [Cohnella ginsengisoli]